jgi:hypothetical protein
MSKIQRAKSDFMPRPPAIRCKREPGSRQDRPAGKCRRCEGANDGSVAMKWHHRIAQGFYEAGFVKAALPKSIFKKFCFVWTAIRRQETCDWLFGA